MKHCKPSACTIGIIVALGQFSSLAWAQTPLGEALQELRRRTDLPQSDVDKIDRYLDEHIAKLETRLNRPKEKIRFQTRILVDYRHADNSSRFKNVFAERCSSRFSEKIKNGPAELSRVLVQSLAEIANPATLDALKEAATSADPATRIRAIGGIHKMQHEIEANPAQVSALISWLGNVGARETNGIVLSYIYQAFSFAIKKDEQAQTILSVLEARLKAFEQGTFSGEDGEVEAYQRLRELASDLNDAGKIQLVNLLAQFLVRYTHRFCYIDLSEESRQTLHRLVFMTERLLSEITRLSEDSNPVSDAIGLNSANRHEKIREAIYGWVGTVDKPGKLNSTNWQVPIGGGVSDLDFNAPALPHSDNPTPEP